ncbi:hypothetical protein AB0O20_20580 [Streptomyces kronopolitis]|uniref:hypothetical protein n=1 Tax=Streptomyces kronopolitis TaxID=1612435 RepID=UPI003433A2D6
MARLLLVVVLATGVFVMHTVGHPDGAAGTGEHAMATGHTTGMVGMSGASAASDTPTRQGTPAHVASRGMSDEPSPHYTPGPGTGMNMASLCLAVLGGWALMTLLGAALTPTPGWLADLLAKTVAVLRPNPPPAPPDLTRLSVLRI